ncbi:hypothetical protein A3I27_00865 [Candidatus Giovannonibacteria bacterium RIFCSPLOWO2_02_FULL_43_11b]|nr:MAG: hypothetical protein A3I27_00865 [Candidatus Giovannonibacteria bacterium RIFCSPLOWO2_02_FULL_43_11b]
MKKIIIQTATRIIIFLSHRPGWYALIVGVGIVLFWRGVWHSVDQIHTYFNYYSLNPSIDLVASPWWDGPLSLFVGSIILYFTGAFISSFIGNELILSGLRGEKRLNQKTEVEVRSEMTAITDIKNSIKEINRTLDQLEQKMLENPK